jgi:hypothetical protein
MKATEYFRVVVDVVLCRINAMMNDSTLIFLMINKNKIGRRE